MRKQPIDSVEWVERSLIKPNDYNPNTQPPPEFKLLVRSLLENGWTQPIVVFDDDEEELLTIVDGEHRYRASGEPAVHRMTDGLVPVVRIVGKRSDLMMATVRHNRARGEHAVLRMADIVRELLESGLSKQEIETRLGMEDEEVERLATAAGMTELAGEGEFSKGWIPK